jgi:restriction system protein
VSKNLDPQFQGRHHELERLDQFLRERSGPDRPLVITGMGGIGKTALIRHWVGSRFSASDVEYVDLYNLAPAADLTTRIVASLSARPSPPQILVLDGAERIDPRELSGVLRTISSSYPRMPVVIASRRQPGFEGEIALQLGGLTEQESIRLMFPEGLPEGEGLGVSALIAELGGNPLALTITRDLVRDSPTVAKTLLLMSGPLYDLEEQTEAAPQSAIELIRPQIILPTQRMIERLKEQPEDIYRLTPREFERLVASLLEDMGFDVELTRETHDGGVDILAFARTQLGQLLCLVQAKRYSRDHPVGIEVVRNLYGTFCDREANSALLVTSSRFTEDARTFARRHEYVLTLREYGDLVGWLQQYGRRGL